VNLRERRSRVWARETWSERWEGPESELNREYSPFLVECFWVVVIVPMMVRHTLDPYNRTNRVHFSSLLPGSRLSEFPPVSPCASYQSPLMVVHNRSCYSCSPNDRKLRFPLFFDRAALSTVLSDSRAFCSPLSIRSGRGGRGECSHPVWPTDCIPGDETVHRVRHCGRQRCVIGRCDVMFWILSIRELWKQRKSLEIGQLIGAVASEIEIPK
jgi:hypothetical protein